MRAGGGGVKGLGISKSRLTASGNPKPYTILRFKGSKDKLSLDYCPQTGTSL